MKKIASLFCIYCLLYNTGCFSKVKDKVSEKEGKYTVIKPLALDTTFTKDYVAQIQSVKNIEVRAQEKGYLQSINVDEGQYVRAGQVLFRIMPKIYEAECLKAKAEVKEAELELLNSKTLADKNIVSKTEQAIKQAKLDQARAELALAQIHLSLTEIKAPFDGIIDRIRFKLGSLIDEGGLLTTLSDNKSIYAYFNVSEGEYLNYKARANANEKQTVSLVLANNQLHKYNGTIETIEGEFDNETGNIAFRAKFPNPEMLLKHGETGKVKMTIPLIQALVIPQKATYELQDKIYVYVVDKDNRLKSRSIIIKQKLSNLYVVDSGLEENDRILIDGLQTAKEDEKIEVEEVPARTIIDNLQLIKQ